MPAYQPLPTNEEQSSRGFKLADAAAVPSTTPIIPSSATLKPLPSSIQSQEAANEPTSSFIISLMYNGQVTKLSCSPAWTLGQVKHQSFPSESAPHSNKLIRFIYLGRVLSDENVTLQQLGVESGHALHVMITDKPLTVDLNASGGQPTHGVPVPVSNTALPTGYIPTNAAYPAQNYQYLHTLAAEYQLQQQHHQQPLAIHEQHNQQQVNDGNQSDFMLGCLMGVLLGPLSVFFLLLRVGSRRLKLGIVSGLMLNLFFTLLNTLFAINDTGHQQHGRGG